MFQCEVKKSMSFYYTHVQAYKQYETSIIFITELYTKYRNIYRLHAHIHKDIKQKWLQTNTDIKN